MMMIAWNNEAGSWKRGKRWRAGSVDAMNVYKYAVVEQ